MYSIEFVRYINNSFNGTEEIVSSSETGNVEFIDIDIDSEKFVSDDFFSCDVRRAKINFYKNNWLINKFLLKKNNTEIMNLILYYDDNGVEITYNEWISDGSKNDNREVIISDVSKIAIKIYYNSSLIYIGFPDISSTSFNYEEVSLSLVDYMYIFKTCGETFLYNVSNGDDESFIATSYDIFNQLYKKINDKLLLNFDTNFYQILNTVSNESINILTIENVLEDINCGLVASYSNISLYENINTYLMNNFNIQIISYEFGSESPFETGRYYDMFFKFNSKNGLIYDSDFKNRIQLQPYNGSIYEFCAIDENIYPVFNTNISGNIFGVMPVIAMGLEGINRKYVYISIIFEYNETTGLFNMNNYSMYGFEINIDDGIYSSIGLNESNNIFNMENSIKKIINNIQYLNSRNKIESYLIRTYSSNTGIINYIYFEETGYDSITGIITYNLVRESNAKNVYSYFAIYINEQQNTLSLIQTVLYINNLYLYQTNDGKLYLKKKDIITNSEIQNFIINLTSDVVIDYNRNGLESVSEPTSALNNLYIDNEGTFLAFSTYIKNYYKDIFTNSYLTELSLTLLYSDYLNEELTLGRVIKILNDITYNTFNVIVEKSVDKKFNTITIKAYEIPIFIAQKQNTGEYITLRHYSTEIEYVIGDIAWEY